MNLNEWMARMRVNADSIQQMVSGVDATQALWKPDAETWSMVEVMIHLYKEEREDFRAYLARGWGLPDPSQQHSEAPYAENDLAAVTQAFMDEREQSLAWLRGLDSPDWEVTVQMRWGPFKLGNMMVSWAAHDLLHMRQFIELKYAYIVDQAQPYEVRYAGEW